MDWEYKLGYILTKEETEEIQNNFEKGILYLLQQARSNGFASDKVKFFDEDYIIFVGKNT